MTRLTRKDIIDWADKKAAEGQLPELIRRLIVVSNPSLEAIAMPYGDSVGRSGLDGFVRAENANAYVVAGCSVWEFGRDKAHVSKANKDFKKRTKNTAKFRQQQLTYCCVTPRHWEKKAEWRSNPGPKGEKISSDWKEIRVYDVDDLLGWISDCPSVEAWFSRILGKATAGLRDVDGYWMNVGCTDDGIAISPKVLLAGRTEISEQIQTHFSNWGENVQPMAISSRSPAEVVPFAVASVIDSGDESTLTRTLVVDSRQRWEQLIVEESALGLIVAAQVQPTREELQQASNRDHHVVYCTSSRNADLPRLSEYYVREALVDSGVSEARATQHARQCGGNGEILLDRLSGLDASSGGGGSSLDDRVKVACLLLVAWDGEHAADREVFSLLSGMEYDDIEASLVSDSNDPNGLLFRADGKFRLLSPEQAWIRHAHLITKSVTDNFADVVKYLLADDDPTAGMSDTERLTAQFLGKRPEFSGTLRQNVVHSLAIASSIEATELNLDPSMSPMFVDQILRSTFEGANFDRWASFGGELAILAEAAPDAVLDALEGDLSSDGALKEVMNQSDPGFFGRSAHTGVLWGLERLCWSPDYLRRAVRILLRLAAINPEIKSGNNPANSIKETLQAICPQTNADWSTRREAITALLEEDSGLAFPMVISLMPIGHQSWMRRETPLWQKWAYGYSSSTTYGQIRIERQWCVEQLLSFAHNDANRWCALFELCGKIQNKQFVDILDTYESRVNDDAFNDEDKRRLWETINAMLIQMETFARRRRLPNDEVVDEDSLEDPEAESEPHFPDVHKAFTTHGKRLQQLLEKSIPHDPVLAGCHAFLSGLNPNHCARHFTDRHRYEEQQRRIAEKRSSVVECVCQSEGVEGLQRLAELPHVDAEAVGRSAAILNSKCAGINEIIPLFSSPKNSNGRLAAGFVTAWAQDRGDSLFEDVMPHLSSGVSDSVVANILRCLPVTAEVWDYVDSQAEAIQRIYWQEARIPVQIPEGRLSYIVRHLINVKRGDRAIDLLAFQRENLGDDDVESVFSALESLPSVEGNSEGPSHPNLRWEIQELLRVLYKIGMEQVPRLVHLELLYHEVFEDDDRCEFQPKGVLAAIRDSPSFFVEMLSYPWRNDDGEVKTPDDDVTRARANQIRGLLGKLSELPGQSELCPMTDKTMTEWVTEVIRIASEHKFIKAVALQLCPVVANDSWDEIDAWPAPEIAEVINVLADAAPEDCRDLLGTGLANARGMHTIDPSGKSERDIAETMRKRADQLQQSCPAAAGALRENAQCLESEALRNIERAKWER